MSTKSTVILVALFVLCCGAYWAVVSLEATTQERTVESHRFFDFPAEDLHRIAIDRPGQPTIEAVRVSDEHWDVTKPDDIIEPSDPVWDRVANATSALMNAGTIEEDPKDLSIYGLSAPRLTLRGETAGGRTFAIDFGMVDPTQANRYAMREGGGEVMLVSDKAFREFDRPLADFRYPYVFHTPEEGFERIAYVRLKPDEEAGPVAAGEPVPVLESTAVVVALDDNGVWQMVEPVAALADQQKVAELARELQFVTARKHVDAPRSLADYGLEPPSARISVTPKGGGAEQTLYLGWIDDSGEDGGLFAKRADLPTVFTMDGHLVTLLPTSPTSFREKRLVTRSLKGLRSLHYHRGDTELVLEDIPDKGWTLTTPAVDDTDQVAASNFVARLREIEAHRFLGKTQSLFGLVQPDMTISLRFDDLAAPLVVKVGGPTPDPETGYYYACQDTGVVVTVPAGDVEQLQITDFDLRNRQLLAFNPREASRVYLKFEGSEYTFARNPSGVAFDVVQPQGMRFESQSDMAVLLDALKNVYAKARVADPGDAATGLDAPVLVAGVTVRVNDPDTPGAQRDETVDTLVVGNLAEGASHQRYATVASRDEVFLIDQDLISTLRESLRGVRHE